ncbi:MAG: glycosyltransferase [Flavobacteriales bacterium TMED235]|nr:MAG: glycosyltransferase [Flavobacteriales bacterium TMED235]|tara:strand:+ start:1854 stop:3677 length:1824 start_codon:yes stop_codon:yes gene_type:complete
MIKNKDIIIIGSIDWKTNWQTQHRLVSSLLKQNNRVLYIENTGIRSAKISDISRIRDRFNSWFKSAKGFKEVKRNLFIFSPILLPFPFSKICYYFNIIIINFLLSNWLKTLKFKNDILVSFLPTPLSHKIKNIVNANFNIYYCANEMKGIQNKNEKIDDFENLFFKEMDITFVISTNLKKKANLVTKDVFYLPAGVELNKFNFKKVRKKTLIKGKPVIGYIGAVTEVFDQDLLEFVCKKNPNFNFIIIGRVYVNIKKLENLKNLFFLNEIKHDQLPSYLKGFDIGIIPYKVNQFTNSVYSCKLNEYLSMGLPVVSTNLLESKIYNENHKNVIHIANNYEKFSEKIKESLQNNTILRINRRIEAAKKNSWESRIKFFNQLIENRIVDQKLDTISWRKRFLKNYNRLFYTNIKKTFLIIIFLLVIFKSPLIPYFGNFLVVEDKVKNVEMIVVFSGDGENNYHNLSFQKRIIDIKNIKKTYPNIKITLTGRVALFREADIIKSLLISEGIIKEDIIVLKEDPYNTFENIKVVNTHLNKNNVQSIIFLTSPYHTLRSKLIWQKNFPDIEIIIPRMIDSPRGKLTWGVSYEKIKIILYEYLAIIYNKTKGWI